MDTLTNSEARERIKELKRKLAPRYRIEQAILFGSRARGDHLLDSDVDLLLISSDFGPNFHERMRDVAREWDSYVALEPLCYTPDEFNELKARRGIVMQASLEGIPV